MSLLFLRCWTNLLNKRFNMRLARAFSPTVLLALSALLSRLMGVGRDHLLARHFGASAGQGMHNLDAYYAAFRIPDLLYTLLVFGAVSAAFVPLFAQQRKQGETEGAWRFASNLMHFLLLSVLAFSALAWLLAPRHAQHPKILTPKSDSQNNSYVVEQRCQGTEEEKPEVVLNPH